MAAGSFGKCNYDSVADSIVYLYRAMNADPVNPDMPAIGNDAKSLSYRVPRDYVPNEDNLVYPQSTGKGSSLSTNLDPEVARNIGMINKASNPWRIPWEDVPSIFSPVPAENDPNHILWDVEEPVPGEAVQSAIQGTQPLLEKVIEDEGPDF